jgi:hypothetical protein
LVVALFCCFTPRRSTSPSKKRPPRLATMQGTRDISELSPHLIMLIRTRRRLESSRSGRLSSRCSLVVPVVLNFQTALHFRISGANVAEWWWCCYWPRTSADARAECIDVHDLESFAWECELGLHWRSSSWLLDCSGCSGQSATMLFLSRRQIASSLSPSKAVMLEGLAAPAPWESHTMAGLCMMMVRLLHYRRHGAVSCRLRSKGNFSGLIV